MKSNLRKHVRRVASVNPACVGGKVEDAVIAIGAYGVTATKVAVSIVEVAIAGTSIVAGAAIGAGAKLLVLGAKRLLR